MKAFYLNSRFFIFLSILVLFFALSFVWEWLFFTTQVLLAGLFLALFVDILLLFGQKQDIRAKRSTGEKLSNGDMNPIYLFIQNRYSFPITLKIIDEAPIQFQMRDIYFKVEIDKNREKTVHYFLRPVRRGEYEFGALNIYVSTFLSLASKRYRFAQKEVVPVYPSFLQMRKYELLAISNRLSEEGVKKIRRIGHNREFEQVKEYVQGDDVRTINWKATARKNQLMVNHYQDEKSQQVYNIIDKGRVMKMPFEEMTLLDYAINASLVLSNIAMLKDDKAGLITFDHKIGAILPAQKGRSQMQNILETLYNIETNFTESYYAPLFISIKRKIKQRSLIVLYTNFETISGMERQLPFLKSIAKQHVLVVIFFENTELRELLETPAQNTEEIYLKTVAEKFAYEKRLIVKALRQAGIYAVLTKPQNLTVDTINQYLNLKARGVI